MMRPNEQNILLTKSLCLTFFVWSLPKGQSGRSIRGYRPFDLPKVPQPPRPPALRLVRLIGAPSVHCRPPLWDIRPPFFLGYLPPRYRLDGMVLFYTAFLWRSGLLIQLYFFGQLNLIFRSIVVLNYFNLSTQ